MGFKPLLLCFQTLPIDKKTCFTIAKSSLYYRKDAFSVQTMFYACVERYNLSDPHFRDEFELKLNLMALESGLTYILIY